MDDVGIIVLFSYTTSSSTTGIRLNVYTQIRTCHQGMNESNKLLEYRHVDTVPPIYYRYTALLTLLYIPVRQRNAVVCISRISRMDFNILTI